MLLWNGGKNIRSFIEAIMSHTSFNRRCGNFGTDKSAMPVQLMLAR